MEGAFDIFKDEEIFMEDLQINCYRDKLNAKVKLAFDRAIQSQDSQLLRQELEVAVHNQ